MKDTGCTYASSGGLAQYLFYSLHVAKIERIDKFDIAKCKFDVG